MSDRFSGRFRPTSPTLSAAVAALHEMSCVILPEELKMDEGALLKAREESIAVISSPLSAYALCARMAEAGIPA